MNQRVIFFCVAVVDYVTVVLKRLCRNGLVVGLNCSGGNRAREEANELPKELVHN